MLANITFATSSASKYRSASPRGAAPLPSLPRQLPRSPAHLHSVCEGWSCRVPAMAQFGFSSQVCYCTSELMGKTKEASAAIQCQTRGLLSNHPASSPHSTPALGTSGSGLPEPISILERRHPPCGCWERGAIPALGGLPASSAVPAAGEVGRTGPLCQRLWGSLFVSGLLVCLCVWVLGADPRASQSRPKA